MNTNNNLRNEFESMLDSYPVKDAPELRSLITGTVVSKTEKGYFIDLQMKSESFVSKTNPEELDLSIGCSYQFLVTGPEDENGSVPLSRQEALIWHELDMMRQLETISLVTIKSVSKSRSGRSSGLNATINGIKAFIPKSEIPSRQNLGELINQEIAVCILQTDMKQAPGGVVILSHSKALEAIFMHQVESFSPSSTLRCQVIKVMKAGVRVRIVSSGLMGFIPKSELAFDKKASPHAVVEKDDIFDAQILRMDKESLNVVLSRRQAIQSQFLSGVTPGQRLQGKILRKNDYAFFVEVGNCFDAILYKKDVHKDDLVNNCIKEGDLIEADVLSIKIQEGKLFLSTRKNSTKSSRSTQERSKNY